MAPFPHFLHLKLYIRDEDLKSHYVSYAEKHNTIIHNPFPDAGFDLFTPETITVDAGLTGKINFGVKCSAYMIDNTSSQYAQPSGFYLYPRSSTGSKTPLRLTNSVGIIDSGYRGNLMSFFDNIRTDDYIIQKMDKLVQICAPSLVPIVVEIVNNEEELGKATLRGEGGFGSTTKDGSRFVDF